MPKVYLHHDRHWEGAADRLYLTHTSCLLYQKQWTLKPEVLASLCIQQTCWQTPER